MDEKKNNIESFSASLDIKSDVTNRNESKKNIKYVTEKITFFVNSIYKKSGEAISEILIRLIKDEMINLHLSQ